MSGRQSQSPGVNGSTAFTLPAPEANCGHLLGAGAVPVCTTRRFRNTGEDNEAGEPRLITLGTLTFFSAAVMLTFESVLVDSPAENFYCSFPWD